MQSYGNVPVAHLEQLGIAYRALQAAWAEFPRKGGQFDIETIRGVLEEIERTAKGLARATDVVLDDITELTRGSG